MWLVRAKNKITSDDDLSQLKAIQAQSVDLLGGTNVNRVFFGLGGREEARAKLTERPSFSAMCVKRRPRDSPRETLCLTTSTYLAKFWSNPRAHEGGKGENETRSERRQISCHKRMVGTPALL